MSNKHLNVTADLKLKREGNIDVVFPKEKYTAATLFPGLVPLRQCGNLPSLDSVET